MKPVIHVGIDVGSTTVKVAALSPYLKLLFGRYQRHMSDIRSATMSLLKELQEKFSGSRITASISGSDGMGLARPSFYPGNPGGDESGPDFPSRYGCDHRTGRGR